MGSDARERNKALWEAFLGGSEEAFSRIYQRFFADLYNYGRRFTGDEGMIEDCIQQLFVDLWEKRRRLGSTDSIKNYLYASLRRSVLRTISRQKKLPLAGGASLEQNAFQINLSPESEFIRRQLDQEEREALNRALDELSDRQREAIFLKFYEKFSYEEIAQLMSMNVKGVYDLIYKALQRMRRQDFLRQIVIVWVGLLASSLAFFSFL